jgi:hypothetical protein
MKKTLLIITLIASFSASASYYDRLRKMFDQGIKPTKDELIGINVGRCFIDFHPNTPMPELIYASIESSSAGPIDKDKIMGTVIWSIIGKPDLYEELSVGEIIDESKVILPSSEDESNIIFHVQSQLDSTKFKEYEVRKNNDYLVARNVVDTTLEVYCYTFLKR